ncbi:MAG TPA: PDZ domain-containing protein, partial [Povalibacter sp.]
LVGVNSAIFSRSGGNIGIGFAIPSNMVKAVMSQLIQFGEVKRGILGVTLRDLTPAIAESLGLESSKGALVGQVVEGSAAERAGIKAGDIITSINGKTVSNSSETRNLIGMQRIGEKVEIGLSRDSQPRRVTATIAERTDTTGEGAAEVHPAFEGAALGNANGSGGVQIQSVAEGSPAAANGLRANDIIMGIGRQRITNMDQLRAAVKDATAFTVTIRRGNATLVFPIG